MATIKVLIVEDSPLVAEVLTDALQSDRRIRIVGVASNGQEALEMLPKLAPDLITMDVWMPVMDGFATVEWIMANRPTPILVITSSKLKQDVQVSLRMLAAGALDVIEKPALEDEITWKRQRSELVAKVQLLASVRVITHVRGKTPARPASPEVVRPLPPNKPLNEPTRLVDTAEKSPLKSAEIGKPNRPEFRVSRQGVYFFPVKPRFRAIGIASSTGGPTALLQLLKNLPPDLPCPIFVVQHISEGFTQGLVDWLQREIRLKIKIPQDNELPQPGEVLIAPDRRNLLLQPNLRVLTTTEHESILCPNADSLMISMAQAYEARAIGIVLTGMGSDGAKGLKEMYEAGAYTIAQDEASSLIYGMPKAALDAGGARQVLALDNIAPRLLELLQQPESLNYMTSGKEQRL